MFLAMVECLNYCENELLLVDVGFSRLEVRIVEDGLTHEVVLDKYMARKIGKKMIQWANRQEASNE